MSWLSGQRKYQRVCIMAPKVSTSVDIITQGASKQFVHRQVSHPAHFWQAAIPCSKITHEDYACRDSDRAKTRTGAGQRHCQKDVNRDAQKIQANVVFFFFFQTYGAKATTTQNRLIAAGGRDDGQAKARNSRRKMQRKKDVKRSSGKK